jgi:hypothetical protein
MAAADAYTAHVRRTRAALRQKHPIAAVWLLSPVQVYANLVKMATKLGSVKMVFSTLALTATLGVETAVVAAAASRMQMRMTPPSVLF